MRLPILWLYFFAACSFPGMLCGQDETENEREFARVLVRDGQEVLQSAVHRYTSSQDGAPEIVLVGNFHAGTEAYFQSINQQLEQAELVLFEAPGRPPFLSALRKSDRKRASRAKSAAKYICAALSLFAEENKGSYPETLEELAHDDLEYTAHAFLTRAFTDSGWGRPWNYHPTENGFHLVSLGADGQPGGKKADKDLSYDEQSKIVDSYVRALRLKKGASHTRTLQRMGLVDQGSIISYSDPKFVLSDVDEIQVRSLGIPSNLGPPDMVGNTPTPEKGSPAATRQRNQLLRQFVSMNDPARVPWMFGKNPTGQNLKMYEMMVVSRNELVGDDLKWILKQDEKPSNVYVLYGAGHMLDLEERLIQEMGYQYQTTQWLTVCSVDQEIQDDQDEDGSGK